MDGNSGVFVSNPDHAPAVLGNVLIFHPAVAQRDDEVVVVVLPAAGTVGVHLQVDGASAFPVVLLGLATFQCDNKKGSKAKTTYAARDWSWPSSTGSGTGSGPAAGTATAMPVTA